MTCTLRSSRSPKASARASERVSESSIARYSPARLSTADHAAAEVAVGSDANHSVNPSTPARTSTVRHLRVFAACAATWSAATRAATARAEDVTRAGIHRRQPRREVGIHREARVDVEPGARLDHLVRRGHRKVPRQDEIAGGREALTQRGTERCLPTRQPLRHPRRQTHLRRGHRIDVPHRVDPLPRTRLVHRRLHPSTPRPEHRDQTVRAVRDRLRLPSDLERLHRTEPATASAATSRATTAHPSRSAAMRPLSCPLSMPHRTEHPFDTQAFLDRCSATAEPGWAASTK